METRNNIAYLLLNVSKNESKEEKEEGNKEKLVTAEVIDLGFKINHN